MKLYEILQNMKVGEIKEIKGVKDIPDGTIVQCVESNKNCSSDSDICIYRKFNVLELVLIVIVCLLKEKIEHGYVILTLPLK